MQIEIASQPKPAHAVSHDVVGYCGATYWLFDGATPPSDKTAQQAAREFLGELNWQMHAASQRSIEHPAVLLKNVIAATRNALSDLKHGPYIPSATAVVARLAGRALQYAVLGDAYLVVCHSGGRRVVTDDRLQSIARKERAAVRSLAQAGRSGTADYSVARDALIAAEQRAMNVLNGYWIVSLDPAAADHALTGSLTVSDPEELCVLGMSDGFARLATHFPYAADLTDLPRVIRERGATALFRTLRELEVSERLATRVPSSQHDDAAYFLLQGCAYGEDK